MNILHVIPDLGGGGAERLVLDICRAQAGRTGVEARLITLREGCAYPEQAAGVDWTTIPSRHVPRVLHTPVRETRALEQAIRSYRPDVIHLHLLEADMVVRSLGIRGPAYVTHLHSALPKLERPRLLRLTSRPALVTAWDRRVLLGLYRRLGVMFLAVSSYVAGWAEQTFGRRWPVITRPNAVDLDRFRPLPRHPPDVAVRLVSIGRLVAEKNHGLQVAAVARLRARGVPATLDILGEGPDEPALRRAIEALGLAGQVRLRGRVTSIEQVLGGYDLLVHSAIHEPFGLVLLEAMATGLPVVCAEGGAVREVVPRDHAGLVVAQSAEALADGVMDAIRDAERYMQLSSGAVEWSRRFGIDAYVDHLLADYTRATRHR